MTASFQIISNSSVTYHPIIDTVESGYWKRVVSKLPANISMFSVEPVCE
jgi:hypothetical protein